GTIYGSFWLDITRRRAHIGRPELTTDCARRSQRFCREAWLKNDHFRSSSASSGVRGAGKWRVRMERGAAQDITGIQQPTAQNGDSRTQDLAPARDSRTASPSPGLEFPRVFPLPGVAPFDGV